MFRRLAAIFVLGMVMAGGAAAQYTPTCTIENDYNGTFQGPGGSYTITVSPGATLSLRPNCQAPINIFNWTPGNLPGPQIQVTAPTALGSSAQYTLEACVDNTATYSAGSGSTRKNVVVVCAVPVTITLQVTNVPVCSLESDFTGVFAGPPGSYTVYVTPNATGTLRQRCSPTVTSYNWSPGNFQTPEIQVTAPSAAGSTAQYTLTGCSNISFTPVCATPVTITLRVISTFAPDCTLTASPNPALSGQTVTFTPSCNPNRPPPFQFAYTDFSGRVHLTNAQTFSDVAPAVVSPTVFDVPYQAFTSQGLQSAERILQVTVNPLSIGLPPSNCTLTAAPNPLPLGASSLLTAACTGGNAATSYTFLDAGQSPLQTGAGNSLSVTPSTVGTHTYSVRASNAAGQAPLAAVQVVVTSVAAAPSGCTLAAAPNPIVLGGSTTLTGSCTGGGTPTAYAFTYPDGSVVNQTSPVLSVTPPTVGTHTITMVASNAAGSAPAASVGIVVLAAGCSVSGSPPNPVPRNTPVTLTATCNNQPVAYAWSTPAGAVPGGTGSSVTVTPSATTAYTVTASNASTQFPVTATGTYTVVVSSATAIAAVAGGPLTGIPGRPLSRALQVRVSDAAGSPVAGELVNWSVVNPGSSPGSFGANPSVATDAQGLTSNTFTMGADSGGRTLRACLAAAPSVCADFAVLPGASAIASIVGATITGAPGRPLSSELQVRVGDQSGSPVAGELVNWSVVNPGASPGTFASNPSAPSDAQGIARNTFTMGSDAGGRTLRACLNSLPSVCVDFQVVPGAAGLVALAGTPLVGAPGQPLSRALQVRASDAQGNPVPQEIVNWSVVSPGASPGTFAANPSGPTDAQGLTSNTFTMGNDPGGRTLRACLAAQPSVCADFVVRSLNAAVERPASKIMAPLVETALGTPLAQLQNVRFRLEQLRLRRNPAVLEALRVRVAGQALPPLSAFALAPLDKNGKPQRGGGAAADDPFERLGAFVNGDLEFGKQSRNGAQNGFDLNTRGLTAGADYRLPGDSVVGVAAGYMHASADLAEAGGSQGASGYSLSAYGSFVPMSGAYIDVIAHAGSNKYDTRRREVTDAGAAVDYNSNTRGYQYALAITAGADLNRGPLTLNPYLRMDYVNAKVNAFSESGDSGAIRVGDLDLKQTVLTLGGQVSYAISTSWGVLLPNARLELQRRLQGDGRNINAQLVADGAVNAQVALENTDKDYGNVSVGFSAVLPGGVSGFANYERLFGRDGYRNSKYTVGVRFEF